MFIALSLSLSLSLCHIKELLLVSKIVLSFQAVKGMHSRL